MTALDATNTTFGGFALGGLQLALPISALREVAACGELLDLPCPLPCVIGGLVLRGVVIPVIDLRVVLGRATPPREHRTVVIIAHDDTLLGLLADGVTGMFEAVEDSLRQTSVHDATEPLFAATVQRADTEQMVSVLSTHALARLEHLPRVADPHVALRRAPQTVAVAEAPERSVPMLLFACNGIHFAVETAIVQAILFNPPVESAPLAGIDELRVIAYDGLSVPVLDLLTLCGLGELGRETDIQAFVVALPAGFVAFLIGGVLDIVPTRPADVAAVPAFALPRPELIAGSLEARPADVLGSAAEPLAQHLVVDAAGLQSCNEAIAASQLNIAVTGAARRAQALDTKANAVRRSMITYVLDDERTSPLDQVVEILRYEPGAWTLTAAGPLVGLMAHRGRSIPVVCLSQLTGGTFFARTGTSTVLLVESDGELIGFAVRRLNAIEEADWEPTVPPNRLALFGSRRTERLVPMLDLRAIAASLRNRTLDVHAHALTA